MRQRIQWAAGPVVLLVALVVTSVAFGAPGDFDTSFGSLGYQTVGFGALDRATHVAVAPDGRLVLIGTTNAGGTADWAVTRLTAGGGDDLSFSGDGEVIIGTAAGVDDIGGGVVVTADGRVVVSGQGNASKDFVTKRLTIDGAVDPTFAGGTGASMVDFGGDDAVNAMIAQPDGKLVLVGSTSAGGGDFAIVRLDADGTSDTGFSGDGRQTVDLGGADAAIAVANAPGGKLVVAGQGGAGGDMVVVRLNPDGSLDPSFGSGGKVAVDFGGTESGNGVVVGADGSVFVDGGTSAAGSGDFAVAKLSSHGALDPSFSADGRTTLGFGAADEAALALALQQNGKLVVLGTGDPGHDFIAVRLLPDGSPDTGFGTGGTRTVDFGKFEYDGDVVLQPDGRILVAGSTNVQDDGDMAIARLQGDASGGGPAQIPGSGGTSGTPGSGGSAVLPPRNLVPPEVVETRGRNSTSATYRCSDGQWEGLGPDPKFARTLYRVNVGISRGRPIPPTVVSRGVPVLIRATAARRPYFCSVTAPTPDGGYITAVGPVLVVPNYRVGAGAIHPQTIGDLRIRGIDVFQVVQPMSGAGEFSFDGYPRADLAFPSVCGGGTPTALLPPLCQASGAVTQKATYQGVDLDSDKRTSVVVYVDRKPGVDAQIPNQQIRVTLHARAGSRLNASMSQTLRVKDLQSASTDAITATERGDERFGVTFDLPQSWLNAVTSPTNGTFDLDAGVTAINASFNTRQCNTSLVPVLGLNDCQDNDTFTLSGIFARYLPFSALIRPIGLLTSSQTLGSLRSPASAMQGARVLLPAGEKFQIPGYVAQVPIDPVTATNATNCPAPKDEAPGAAPARLRKCASANVTNAVRGWVAGGPPTDPNKSGADGFHVLLALHNYQYAPGATEPGASFNTNGVGYWGRHLNQPYIQINDGTIGRPYTSAAHELLHTYGAPHAGKNLGGIAGDLSCGGDTNGQVGELWPPDDTGRLQGVRFDPATDKRVVDGDTDTPESGIQAPLYDFMSYCAPDEASAWISPRNWNRAFAFMVEAERVVPTSFQVEIKSRALDAPAAASGVVPTLRGTGFALGSVLDGRVRLDGLEPADPGHVVPAGDPASPVRIRALDATGTPIGEAGARLQKDTSTGAVTFIAPVPAGAATVEAVAGGAVADRRVKGRPPVVALGSPRRATRVGRRLEVRWQASDPDGGALTAQVEFSADGRRGWRTVQRGPSTGRAVLPAQLLQTATAGRVRVRVSDGFDIAQVTSGPLRIAGRPPTATIVRPNGGERVPSDARVVLLGRGSDETGRRLRGRALTWFAGRRRLGTGERLRVRLPAGRVRLSLVARDRRGRTAAVHRSFRVDPPALELLTLRVGAVRARARTAVLTIATNVPAIVRAGSRRARVGRRAVRVRVPLPARPAAGVVSVPIRVTATAGGTPITTRVTVLRG